MLSSTLFIPRFFRSFILTAGFTRSIALLTLLDTCCIITALFAGMTLHTSCSSSSSSPLTSADGPIGGSIFRGGLSRKISVFRLCAQQRGERHEVRPRSHRLWAH